MLIDGDPLENPAAPLDDLLQAGLAAAPDELALISAERSLTWSELKAESSALAGGYRRLGLEPGDRLASLMPNRIALVVHYLACFKAGLDVVAILALKILTVDFRQSADKLRIRVLREARKEGISMRLDEKTEG